MKSTILKRLEKLEEEVNISFPGKNDLKVNKFTDEDLSFLYDGLHSKDEELKSRCIIVIQMSCITNKISSNVFSMELVPAIDIPKDHDYYKDKPYEYDDVVMLLLGEIGERIDKLIYSSKHYSLVKYINDYLVKITTTNLNNENNLVKSNYDNRKTKDVEKAINFLKSMNNSAPSIEDIRLFVSTLALSGSGYHTDRKTVSYRYVSDGLVNSTFRVESIFQNYNGDETDMLETYVSKENDDTEINYQNSLYGKDPSLITYIDNSKDSIDWELANCLQFPKNIMLSIYFRLSLTKINEDDDKVAEGTKYSSQQGNKPVSNKKACDEYNLTMSTMFGDDRKAISRSVALLVQLKVLYYLFYQCLLVHRVVDRKAAGKSEPVGLVSEYAKAG